MLELSEFYLSIFALINLSLFWVSIKVTRSPVSPSSLWALGWFLLMFFSALFGGKYYYSIIILFVQLLSVISFILGSTIAEMQLRPLSQIKTIKFERITYPLNCNTNIQLVLIILSLISLGGMLSKFGMDFSSFLNFSMLANTASLNASLVFNGDVALDANETIGFAILQSAFVLNGIQSACLVQNQSRKTIVLLFFLAFLWTIVTTTRSYLMVPLVWWMAAYYATKVYLGKFHELVSFSFIKKILIVLCSLIFLVVFLQAIRLSGTDGYFSIELLEHLRPWIAGYLPALSVWYETAWDGQNHFGINLLRPFFKIFGITIGENIRDTVGIQSIGNAQYSNAMTILRVLIYDFGSIGLVLVTFFCGFVSSIIFRLTIMGNKIAFVLLIAIGTIIIWAPNFWFFSYGSRVLCLFFLFFLLMLTKIKIIFLKEKNGAR